MHAAALGLSTREVAAAAGITHGTVRALVARLDRPPAAGERQEGDEASDTPDEDGLRFAADAA